MNPDAVVDETGQKSGEQALLFLLLPALQVLVAGKHLFQYTESRNYIFKGDPS